MNRELYYQQNVVDLTTTSKRRDKSCQLENNPSYIFCSEISNQRPVCKSNKESSRVNMGLAAFGYDLIKADPFDADGDPGFMKSGRIFQTSCTDKDGEAGYWNFVHFQPYLNCEVDMKGSTYSTYYDFLYGRAFEYAFESAASFELHINYWGLRFGAYAKFAASMQYETSRVSQMFGEQQGEIVTASMDCMTHTLAFDTVTSRPLFTKGFINALYSLESVLNKTESVQKKAYINFVLNYGTHYLNNIQLGASLNYQKTFHSRSTSRLEAFDRRSRFKMSAEACIDAQSGGFWGFKVNAKACLELGMTFNSSANATYKWGYQSASSDLRVVSKGSRPVEGVNTWATTEFVEYLTSTV